MSVFYLPVLLGTIRGRHDSRKRRARTSTNPRPKNAIWVELGPAKPRHSHRRFDILTKNGAMSGDMARQAWTWAVHEHRHISTRDVTIDAETSITPTL